MDELSNGLSLIDVIEASCCSAWLENPQNTKLDCLYWRHFFKNHMAFSISCLLLYFVNVIQFLDFYNCYCDFGNFITIFFLIYLFSRMNINPFHICEQEQSIDDKLASLHHDMATLRIECDRLINKHLMVEKTLKQNCIICPNQESSSAYNTGGESCRSNSITPDGTMNTIRVNPPPPRSPRLLHRSPNIHSPKQPRKVKTTQQNPPLFTFSNNEASLPLTCESKMLNLDPGYAAETFINQTLSPSGITQKLRPFKKRDSWDDGKRFRIPSMSIVLRDHTKPRNMELPIGNIPMPKFFRSTKLRDTLYMFDKPVEELTEWSEDGETAGPSERAQDEQMEKMETAVHFKWKVKRRCDGTRYIVKRPIRSQVLKKREAQLNKERTGVSTDDDALSELKLGHFHTREERKKHLEKERQRKNRIHQKMVESRLIPDQTIVQLSQRKMQRKKERMLLDGFVTTAEVLSQRNPDTNTKHGLLSVTTV